MGLGDKIENAAEKAGGKAKEAAGNATGDESLKAEGQADQGDRGREGRRRHDPDHLRPPERGQAAAAAERGDQEVRCFFSVFGVEGRPANRPLSAALWLRT